MRKAVFLDRDGVLNNTFVVDGIPKPPGNISEVQILDGVVFSIQLLKIYGYLPIVVTNQPDVARGDRKQSEIVSLNRYIGSLTGIDHFYTCFHDDLDKCECRKPAPGLILQAAKELSVDLACSFMVGDRWRDVSAGQAAGCIVYFIDYSYGEVAPQMPFIKVSSLLEATKKIIGESVDTR